MNGVSAVGPSFRVFVTGDAYDPDYDYALTLYRDGVPLYVELTPVDVEPLARVSELLVLTPTVPLDPGRYCTGHFEGDTGVPPRDAFNQRKNALVQDLVFVEGVCFVIGDVPPADDSRITASMQAIATSTRCFNEASDTVVCASTGSYEIKLRWSEVTVGNVDDALSELVANWLVEVRPDDGTPWEEARGELLRDRRVDDVETLYASDIPGADRICARVSAVLWDGTVLPPYDAGCDDF